MTKLKIDLQTGSIEVEGSDELVLKVYEDFKNKMGQEPLIKEKPILPNAPSPAAHGQSGSSIESYASLSEAIAAINIGRNLSESENVLVAATYLQKKSNLSSMKSRLINSELKNLGRAVGNMPREIDVLIAYTPHSLMVQLKKNGKTKQATKDVKVVPPGEEYVSKLLAGEDPRQNNG